MLSRAKTLKILGKTKLADEQITKLREDMYTLAEIFVEERVSDSGSKKHSWVIDSTTKNDAN